MRRPGFVTLISLLNIVGGVLLLGLVIDARKNLSTAMGVFTSAETTIGMLILLQVLGIASGVGAWLGKRWGWWLVAFLFLYRNILSNAYTLLLMPRLSDLFGPPSQGTGYQVGREISQIVVGILLLVWWFQRNVREYFRLETLSLRKSSVGLLAAAVAMIVAGNLTSSLSGSRLGKALDLYDAGDRSAAAHELEIYLETAPGSIEAWQLLAQIQSEQGEHDQAVASLEHALDLNPEHAELWNALGLAHADEGDYREAMPCYEQALALDAGDAYAHSNLAVAALVLHEDEVALEHARLAYAINSKDPTIAANLAVAYHYNGQVEDRDRLALEAKTLGYEAMDTLQLIFEGVLTIRD
jgi:tetratricopeptide (TPR) repeat protein